MARTNSARLDALEAMRPEPESPMTPDGRAALAARISGMVRQWPTPPEAECEANHSRIVREFGTYHAVIAARATGKPPLELVKHALMFMGTGREV